MPKVFSAIYYSDAGHGWAKVKRSVLQNLDIEDYISPFSYQRDDNVYLEEDNDLEILRERLAKDNVELRLVYKAQAEHSRIRSYDSFKPASFI